MWTYLNKVTNKWDLIKPTSFAQQSIKINK